MAYSFSASTKEELCRAIPSKKCCALAECFGILLYCNSFSSDGIRIITESREFGAMLPKLFKKAFGIGFDAVPTEDTPGKLNFLITDRQKLKIIMDAFGFDASVTLCMHVNMPVVEEECCKNAFIRGAFLAGGSVTDPEKGYHLEMTTSHSAVAGETYLLIHEGMGFAPKIADRSGGKVLYLKQSDSISDFLAYLGASVASMGIIEAKLEKELNNKVNRRCNCDDANLSKIVSAAQGQVAAIKKLEESGMLAKLPEKLAVAAKLRLENPEASLAELAAMVQPPITKPAMNHRLQKLAELAKESNQ